MSSAPSYSSLHEAFANADFARALQNMLHAGENGRSFYDKRKDGSQLKIDGVAGEYTIKGLQSWAGADPDGVLGPKSMAAIRKKLGLAANATEAQMTQALQAKLQKGGFYNDAAKKADQVLPSTGNGRSQLKAMHPKASLIEPDDGHDNYTFKSRDVAIGDSIAYGSKHFGNMDGNTRKSRSPAEVLQVIQTALAKDPNAFRGKNVILSTGLTNGNTDTTSAYQSIKLLADAGANVVVDGVSAKKYNDLNKTLSGYVDSINARLKAYGKPNRVEFGGAITNLAPDNTHPTVSGYQEINASASSLFKHMPSF